MLFLEQTAHPQRHKLEREPQAERASVNWSNLLISKAYFPAGAHQIDGLLFPAKKMNRMQNVKERWPKISTSNQISFCGLE